MTDCPRFEGEGMKYIDGEMSAVERAEFERHCAGCASCRRELDSFTRLDALAGRVKMVDPTDAFWERYWRSVYRRVERKTAWVLMLAGAVMIAVYALRQAIESFHRVTFETIAVLLFAAGFVLLLVSLIRERCHQYKNDPYKDVKR
jgi:anti-sigma factor RsiW